jgi:hypothetical protein
MAGPRELSLARLTKEGVAVVDPEAPKTAPYPPHTGSGALLEMLSAQTRTFSPAFSPTRLIRPDPASSSLGNLASSCGWTSVGGVWAGCHAEGRGFESHHPLPRKPAKPGPFHGPRLVLLRGLLVPFWSRIRASCVRALTSGSFDRFFRSPQVLSIMSIDVPISCRPTRRGAAVAPHRQRLTSGASVESCGLSSCSSTGRLAGGRRVEHDGASFQSS